jgi:hypothetical protein
MTAVRSRLKPPVGLDQGDEFANIHSAQFTLGALEPHNVPAQARAERDD